MSDNEYTLVGRGAELRALTTLLRDGGLGLPRCAVVLGEPGIGKTRLLSEFESVAQRRGFEVVVARAQPGTHSVPAGTLLSVLPSAPPSGDEASVLWWVRNTLQGLADDLVLLVDDAHLADDLTLAVCSLLADSGRIPVVLAGRSTEPHPDGLAHIRRSPGVKSVDLGVLDRDEVASLVSQMDGADAEATAIDELYRLTSGVPLVVRELVRAAEESGVPLSMEKWTWDPAIASEPRLASLFAGRLRHLSTEAREVLWVTVAADGSVPEQAAVSAGSRRAVDEALRRGLLTESDGWLTWSHSLLEQLAVESLSRAHVDEARRTLQTGLNQIDKDDPEVLRLSARVDLRSGSPDYDLQVAAANRAFSAGRDSEALDHAGAALSVDPEAHEANLAAALPAIRLGIPEAGDLITRALETCETDDQYLATASQCTLLLFGTGGDADAAIALIAQAHARADGAGLRRRLEYLRIVVQITSLPPERFLAEATAYLADEDTHPRDAIGVEGMLSIMLAALGDVDRASRASRSLRTAIGEANLGWLDYDMESGFYGGALAALFSGDAIEASRLVELGSRIPTPEGEADVGRRSMACSMGQARGHTHVGMPEFVRATDEAAMLRYSVMSRIYSTWELALRRDPRADVVWNELQQAPAHLRAGPGFLEAIAGVALLASKGDTAAAGESALQLAAAMGPARSAAAWLLHDAARHGRSAEAIAGLDAIAGTQSGRYLPAMFADSARAMCSADCAALAAVAAEFRTGGFDLFAAELDTLAARVHKDAGETVAAGECTARAQADLQRAGNPWTPIVDVLGERGSLTDRQREICGLVVAGLTNAQIATELGISKRTVENQLHRSYTTLGVDRAGLSEVDL